MPFPVAIVKRSLFGNECWDRGEAGRGLAWNLAGAVAELDAQSQAEAPGKALGRQIEQDN